MESPFLALPREIRDQIYDNALIAAPKNPLGRRHYMDNQANRANTYDKPRVVTDRVTWPGRYDGWILRKEGFVSPGLALLRANKQIHQEAAEALYGGVRFVMKLPRAGDKLVAEIGLSNASLIRHLDFHIPFQPLTEKSLNTMQKACTGLLTLRVIPDHHYYHDTRDDRYKSQAWRDVLLIHHTFINQDTDVCITLVMTGSRDCVTGWTTHLAHCGKQSAVAHMERFFELLRWASSHKWNVRREQVVYGRYPDGERSIDHLTNELFHIIEDPLDVQVFISRAIEKRRNIRSAP